MQAARRKRVLELANSWLHCTTSPGRTAAMTTVVCVRKGPEVVIMADGQVTAAGSTILKPNVTKTRVLNGDGPAPVIAGFAGATADALALLERLETQIEQHPGQLLRAAVELATNWRMDRALRRLDASIIVADKSISLQLTGNGDVVESHDDVLSIGSGSPYAGAAARALLAEAASLKLDAEGIAERAMKQAASSCVYTNDVFTVLKIHEDGLAANTSS